MRAPSTYLQTCGPNLDESSRCALREGATTDIVDIESSLSPWISLVLLLGILVSLGCLLPAPLRPSFTFTAAVSVTSYLVTLWLVPVLGRRLSSRGLCGRDLHKAYPSPHITEAGGLCCVLCFFGAATASQILLDPSHISLVEYPAALLGATSMGFLGFVDDTLALPWRAKLVFPLVAAAPILVAYSGRTEVLLPETYYMIFRSACLSIWRNAHTFFERLLAFVSWSVSETIYPFNRALIFIQEIVPMYSLFSLVEYGRASLAAVGSSVFQILSDECNIAPFLRRSLSTIGRLDIPGVSAQANGRWILVQLGGLYYGYMTMLTIFCTNAINIYAGEVGSTHSVMDPLLKGINGLEVGQSIVIAGFVCVHNILEFTQEVREHYMSRDPEQSRIAEQHVLRIQGAKSYSQHFFSLILCLPFLATSLGLLSYNWFPARIFVGDTYTYFAGVVLAAAGILGHFSKTLLLFFIPQCVNFFLSIPQLLGLVKCPRHRTPRYVEKSGLLEASPNLTLVNAVLTVLGPTSEKKLLYWLLLIQILCCIFGLVLRYYTYTLPFFL